MSAKTTKLARLAGESTALRDRVAELERQIAESAHAKALAAIADLVGAEPNDPPGVVFHVRELRRNVAYVEKLLGDRERRLERVRRAAAGDDESEVTDG